MASEVVLIYEDDDEDVVVMMMTTTMMPLGRLIYLENNVIEQECNVK